MGKYQARCQRVNGQLDFAQAMINNVWGVYNSFGFQDPHLQNNYHIFLNEVSYLQTVNALQLHLDQNNGEVEFSTRITMRGSTRELPKCSLLLADCQSYGAKLTDDTTELNSIKSITAAYIDNLTTKKSKKRVSRTSSTKKILKKTAPKMLSERSIFSSLEERFLSQSLHEIETLISTIINNKLTRLLSLVNNHVVKYLAAICSSNKGQADENAAAIVQTVLTQDSVFKENMDDAKQKMNRFPEHFNLDGVSYTFSNLQGQVALIKTLVNQQSSTAFNEFKDELSQKVDLFILSGKTRFLTIAGIEAGLKTIGTDQMVFCYRLGRVIIKPFEDFFRLFPQRIDELDANSPLRPFYQNGFIVQLQELCQLFSKFYAENDDPSLQFASAEAIERDITRFDDQIHQLLDGFFKGLDSYRQDCLAQCDITQLPRHLAQTVVDTDETTAKILMPSLRQGYKKLSALHSEFGQLGSSAGVQAKLVSTEQAVRAYVDSIVQRYQSLQAPLRALHELSQTVIDNDRSPSRPPPKAPTSCDSEESHWQQPVSRPQSTRPAIQQRDHSIGGESQMASSPGSRCHTCEWIAPNRERHTGARSRRTLTLSPREEAHPQSWSPAIPSRAIAEDVDTEQVPSVTTPSPSCGGSAD